MTALLVREACDADAARWDRYVLQRGTFFHRFAWRSLIAETFRQKAIYLIAERGGELVGILPLTDRRSAFFGRSLISSGFLTGGGALADDDDVSSALLSRAQDHADRCGADYIELRGGRCPDADWARKEDIYDAFSLQLADDDAQQMARIPRKKRADVRKAVALGSSGELDVSLTEDTSLFWQGFAKAQRDHGTPVVPRSYFARQKDHFGADMEIAILRAGRSPIAGVVSYYHGSTVHLYSSFISPEARGRHAGDYLYWWMMGHARRRGVTEFDLGRSKRGTGSHAYKRFWGFTPQPMVYWYRLIQTEQMPNINPLNPKFALMTTLWKRLPLPVANSVGPVLSRHLA
jgi:FemAB-related protein (PEP-CTERM system-associated)